MRNLLLKDLILTTRNWLFLLLCTALLIIFVFANSTQTTFFYAMEIFGISYALFSSAISYDDKNNSDILFNSLPIKRSRIVMARYLSLFMFVLIGTFLSLLIGGVSQAVHPGLFQPLMMSAQQSMLMGAISFWLTSILYLPLYFKWGYQKSRVFNVAIFFSVFFIPVIIGSLERVIPQSILKKAIDFFRGQPAWMLETEGLLLVLLLGCLSCFLSCVIYNKREF
ncbi:MULTISPECIES: ABC-2 transporter permease [unclassified Thermoactinomyces]|jgi:ABC-2 type transport system permease protein|uniref:ABC-2 transporter permease n=1 Tax=unclassified Thermoactinomyces TaxID=2634588 RepID=UPI0018DD63E1|nr:MULTISPECIES: ABC-2 transporter permease [unclassified Thermoactinomyces]MBH8598105.1 ABC-2 transporter permease [Thermoactinomyces sp. CICC 10523]MBH8603136.1 ABC-2 transporter permease [Thermoactinomyces sp. CICC 10522]